MPFMVYLTYTYRYTVPIQKGGRYASNRTNISRMGAEIQNEGDDREKEG